MPSEEESLQTVELAAAAAAANNNANQTNDENDRPLLFVIVTDYNMQ